MDSHLLQYIRKISHFSIRRGGWRAGRIKMQVNMLFSINQLCDCGWSSYVKRATRVSQHVAGVRLDSQSFWRMTRKKFNVGNQPILNCSYLWERRAPPECHERDGRTDKDFGRCLCSVKVREVRVICIKFYILPLQELCEREVLTNIWIS